MSAVEKAPWMPDFQKDERVQYFLVGKAGCPEYPDEAKPSTPPRPWQNCPPSPWHLPWEKQCSAAHPFLKKCSSPLISVMASKFFSMQASRLGSTGLGSAVGSSVSSSSVVEALPASVGRGWGSSVGRGSGGVGSGPEPRPGGAEDDVRVQGPGGPHPQQHIPRAGPVPAVCWLRRAAHRRGTGCPGHRLGAAGSPGRSCTWGTSAPRARWSGPAPVSAQTRGQPPRRCCNLRESTGLSAQRDMTCSLGTCGPRSPHGHQQARCGAKQCAGGHGRAGWYLCPGRSPTSCQCRSCWWWHTRASHPAGPGWCTRCRTAPGR